MNNTEFFYNGFNDNNDDFLDPFNPSKNPPKQDAPVVKTKKHEKFEIVVNRNLQTIVSVVLLLILYFKCMNRVAYEFLRSGDTEPHPLRYISLVLIIGCAVTVIYFFIKAFTKALKRRQNISARNTFIAAGVALMTDIAYIICEKLVVPNMIIIGIIAAVIITATVLLMIKVSEENDRKETVLVIASLLAMFIYFITFSVFISTVYHNEADYSAKLFCIQSASLEKNEKDLVIVSDPIMNQLDENTMYLATDAAFPDRVLHSKGELDGFYKEAEKIRTDNGCNDEKHQEAVKVMQKVLDPELSKYDESFFRDNVLIIVSATLYDKIDNASVPQIFTKESTHTSYIRFNLNELPTNDPNTDNHGICYALISMPKDKAEIFSRQLRLL